MAAAGAVVAPEHIADCVLQLVIDDVDILVAITIVIKEGGRETGAQREGVVERQRDIGEAAIAIVVIESVSPAR